MEDECKITRWLLLPDVFQSVQDIKTSATLPEVIDNEPMICRWMLDSDTWSIPKPSEVFPAPTTNEVKITQWQTDEDLWSEVKELTLIRVVVTPTHIYTK